MVSYLCRTRF